MKTTTETNFRANVEKYLDLVIDNGQEVIINRGDNAVVLIPLDKYNSIKETEYLMSSEKMEKIILLGLQDAKKGNYKEVKIDEL